MSIRIKTWQSNHNVWLAHAAHYGGSFAYEFYEQLPDGRMVVLTPTTHTYDVSHFSQGKEVAIGNKPVTHSKLTGDLEIFPACEKDAITRTVSHNAPWPNEMSNYSQEHIRTATTGCEGGSSYDRYRKRDFFNPYVNCHYESTWTLRTKYSKTTNFDDSKRVTSEVIRYYRMDFPPLNRSGFSVSSDGSAVAPIRATNFVFDESGRIIRQESPTIYLKYWGRLSTPDYQLALKLLPIPVAGGAVVPDDLLVRLSKKAGSLKVNNLANIAQLRALHEFLPPLIKSSGKVFKTVADLLLWYQYSIKTTEGDFKSMFEYYLRQDDLGLDRSKGYSHRVIISNKPDANTTDRFIFYLGSYQQSILDKFGLKLNFENTWDLIPFSFVVDWFTKIGDMLASLDAVDEWAHVPVVCFTKSRKAYRPYQLPDDFKQAVGNLKAEFYCREVSTELPVVVVSPDLNIPRGNLLTAVSLAISNKR